MSKVTALARWFGFQRDEQAPGLALVREVDLTDPAQMQQAVAQIHQLWEDEGITAIAPIAEAVVERVERLGDRAFAPVEFLEEGKRVDAAELDAFAVDFMLAFLARIFAIPMERLQLYEVERRGRLAAAAFSMAGWGKKHKTIIPQGEVHQTVFEVLRGCWDATRRNIHQRGFVRDYNAGNQRLAQVAIALDALRGTVLTDPEVMLAQAVVEHETVRMIPSIPTDKG